MRLTSSPRPKSMMLAALILTLAGTPLLAQEGAAPTPEELRAAIDAIQTNANILWTIIAAVLVFFMQAGFAMVEAGFTRAKSAGNIMMKNLMDASLGALAFWAVGFGLMFGASFGYVGGSGFFMSFDNTTADGQWGYTFWMFQVVFAATAATIVSGAMAERTKFISYLCYSFLITMFIYPVFGHWAWGNLLIGDNSGAWLADLGFIDFAGSSVVHSVGGWAALAGAIVLGPRMGKFTKDGKARAIPGHSLTLAALGVFILFVGWFGFNSGSTTTADGSISRIAVNTFLAACMGAIGAMTTSWFKFGKPDIGMSLNGTLAGLVAITAPCATVTPVAAIMLGFIAGPLVVFSVLFFDRIKIDDPVGAISVHGVCGAWGTLAAALFHEELFSGGEYALGNQLMIQLIGIAVAFIWVFAASFVMFKAINAVIGLRVSPEEEMEGLDLSEHGASSYPDFAPSVGAGGVSMAYGGMPLSGVASSAKVKPAEAES